ncbi:MAG: hypothetical protein GWP12_02900, partial [Nitrospirae bacterium]|nr:hypothetical protein [Nitrospirota bacterium]
TPAQALGLEDAVRSAYRGERCTYVLNSGIMLPLAWLGYRFIELPGIRLGRALEERWWKQPAGQAAVVRR